MACIQPSSGWGSSPRVQGTPERSRWRQRRHGIISACAGNTPRRSRRGATSWDHPRVCGEHCMSPSVTAACMGSSPRVRGTLLRDCGRDDRTGIIPACAGNTLIGRGALPRSGDHPRVCGEHRVAVDIIQIALGSSPRVRGTQRSRALRRPRCRGIIPACAGNTTASTSASSGAWDHPRVCGEHDILVNRIGLMLGSSPRVRGTPGHAGDSR